jgi:hypothetical protein
MNKGHTFYELLEVTEDATEDEIRRAYYRLAKEYHPDRIPAHLTRLRAIGERKFRRISEAYEVLNDRQRRRAYDMRMRSASFKGRRKWNSGFDQESAAPQTPADSSRDSRRGFQAPIVFTSLVAILVAMSALLSSKSDSRTDEPLQQFQKRVVGAVEKWSCASLVVEGGLRTCELVLMTSAGEDIVISPLSESDLQGIDRGSSVSVQIETLIGNKATPIKLAANVSPITVQLPTISEGKDEWFVVELVELLKDAWNSAK